MLESFLVQGIVQNACDKLLRESIFIPNYSFLIYRLQNN